LSSEEVWRTERDVVDALDVFEDVSTPGKQGGWLVNGVRGLKKIILSMVNSEGEMPGVI
jgi:hypothetical protein